MKCFRPSTSHPRNLRKSFTLIELLIVIAIMGILAAAVLVAINPLKRMSQARDAQRKMDLGQVKNALEAYNVIYGSYPTTGCDGCWYGDAANFGGFGYTGPTGYIPNLAPDFIKTLPQDPRGHTVGSKNAACTDNQSGYLYSSGGKDYKLLAHCTPENYGENDKGFIDPDRDGDATWGGDGICSTQVTGPGNPWAYAVWSSDTSKCW